MDRAGRSRPQPMRLADVADFDRRYSHLYRYHAPLVTGVGMTLTPDQSAAREGGK